MSSSNLSNWSSSSSSRLIQKWLSISHASFEKIMMIAWPKIKLNHLSLSLSHPLFLSLSIYLFLPLSPSLPLSKYLSLSVYLPIYLSPCLFLYFSLFTSLSVYFYLSFSLTHIHFHSFSLPISHTNILTNKVNHTHITHEDIIFPGEISHTFNMFIVCVRERDCVFVCVV